MTRIAVLTSRERCGIQTYSAALAEGLREEGHRVDVVGIGWWDSRALLLAALRLPRDVRTVVVEHEFALFRNLALALAMLWLRLGRKRVILSLHELEPDKFWNYHKVVAGLHYRMRGGPLVELARVLWFTGVVAQRMLRYRFTLWLLGAFPQRIVLHSPRARENAGLVTGDARKLAEVPHFAEPLAGVPDPAMQADAERERTRQELRRELGLPPERFVFVSPGFLFRRKRLPAVIAATPPDALLVIAGTESSWDRGHLAELERSAAGRENVLIRTDYDALPRYLLAADAVVLFYERTFQSGIASHAVWALKPLILTDDAAFRMYEGAALFVADEAALARAMVEIQRPEVREPLVRRARELRERLSPRAMARLYLEGLEPR